MLLIKLGRSIHRKLGVYWDSTVEGSGVAQSCPTLCDPMDCSLPGFSVLEIPRQEYWSGLPFPSLGDLPDPGIEPLLLALANLVFTTNIT